MGSSQSASVTLTCPLNRAPIKLGNGSFGEVYLVNRLEATGIATPNLMAVKLCHVRHRSLVKSNLDVLLRLRGRPHRHVLGQPHGTRVTDWYTDHDDRLTFYVLMDYHPRTLEDFLGRGLINIRVSVCQLLMGLKHLHILGIIHNDIKPDNILISREGDCVLNDFDGCDLVNPADPNSQDANHIMGCSSLFTPEYRPPEKEFSGCMFTENADVFSLGMTFHTILHHDRINLQRSRPTWFPDVEDLIKEMTESDPLKRLSTDAAWTKVSVHYRWHQEAMHQPAIPAHILEGY